MGTQRALRRAASLLAAASLVVAVSCLAPTEVTLVLTTDIPCGAQNGTSIAVGDPDDVTTSAPVTVTGDCTQTGPDSDVPDGGALAVPASIGSLVVVPSASRSASFAVQIVMAVAPVAEPGDCIAPAYTGCIVARRQISFIPHTPLTLPIEITLDCKDIPCSATNTCYHGKCVSDDTVCPDGTCVTEPDASSSGDDVTTIEEAGLDATMGPPDALAGDELEMDAPAVLMEEASTIDAPASEGPPDVGLQDAPAEAAPQPEDAAPEASIHDAAVDVGSSPIDASGTSPPPEGGIASDAGPLGACILDAGQSSGVECAGSRCPSGDVCCVSFDPGVQTTEACSALAACDYNGIGSTTYSALGCRDVGDCSAGKMCCATASTAGNGTITQCLASCPYIATTQRTACQNSCECPSGQPQCNAVSCAAGYTLGFCGASSGSSCPF